MDPDVNTMYSFLWIVGLIAFSGFFSACEGAIVSMNDTRLNKLAEEGNKSAKKLIKLTSQPTVFLATIQTGVTLCGFFASAILAKIFPIWAVQLSKATSWNTNTAFITVVILGTVALSFVMIVFGKLFPKRLSEHHNESLALGFASIISLLSKILYPIVILLSKISDFLIKLCGIKQENNLENVTEEEIRMMVDVGEEKGVIEQSEKDMINNIFEFDDRNVSEIMTHRMDVVAVDKNASFDTILNDAMESGYSRIPVYEEDIDNIIGIIYVKDLLKNINSPEKFTIKDTMREALFVPESTSCTELLKVFKNQKKQLAVIVDEYGGTYGIVTMEDLLESIVGDIQDEYDNEEEEIQSFSDGSYTFDGSISVDEVEQTLNVEIVSDDDDYDTLGAVLIHKLGHIPKIDENAVVIISGVLFRVMEADERRILKIKAEFINSDDIHSPVSQEDLD